MLDHRKAEEENVRDEETSSPNPFLDSGGFGANLFVSDEFLNQWKSLIEPFVNGSGIPDAKDAEKESIERMLNANSFFMLLNDFWNDTLKEFPKFYEVKNDQKKAQEIMDGWLERYQTLFKKHTDIPLSGEIEQITGAWLNMFQMHQSTAGKVFNPWIAAMPDWGNFSEKVAQGDLSALDKGFHLWLDTYNDTIGRVFNMPALGLTKQHAEKLKRVHDEFTQFSSSLPFFHQYIYRTGLSAMKEVFDKVQKSELDTPTPENLREIYNIWLTTNEKAFFKLFQRPDFCTTTSEIVHSFLRVKRQLDDLTATWCAAMSIPTNQDHDKMAMTIQDLKRKVRKQQKDIEALQQKVESL